MGQNLILNMDSKGFVVCAYNRTVEKVQQFLDNEAKGTNIIGATSLQDMVNRLKSPRKVMMLVKGASMLIYILTVLKILINRSKRASLRPRNTDINLGR